MKFKLILLILLPLSVFSKQDTLRVAVYNKPPFGSVQEDGSYHGLMIDLWENIANDLQLHYRYESVDMESLIEGLNSGTYQIGLGAISVTPERERLVDFTHAVNPSGTTIAIANHSNNLTFSDKAKPILRLILILFISLLLILIVFSSLVWLIERKKIKQIDENNTIKNFKDGLWWSATTMTTVGHNDNLPMSRTGKGIGFIWMFVSIIFVSLFTANASVKLSTLHEVHNKYSTIEDLKGAKIITVENSSGEAYLKREHINHSTVLTLDEALNLLIDGQKEVIVYNAPVLNYYNNRIKVNQLEVMENYLLKNNMAIALQPNSPYKEEINISLLEHITEPKWQQALYENIGNRNPK